MRKLSAAFIILIIFLSLTMRTETKSWDENSTVVELLQTLGEKMPAHYLDKLDSQAVRQGEEMVKFGRANMPNGSKSKYISKFYNCTSCHNLAQEDPDLRVSDPETRLSYIKGRNMSFLQGSTFFGMVNRETWYNDDYVTKYGDLAVKAHDDLKESIQLCAEVCSQGRTLEDWELNAILSYCWTLGFKLSDLSLSEDDLQRINREVADKSKHPELRQWVKSHYNLKSPATFVDSPPNKKKGYEGLTGRAEVGKDIYKLSCQTCHHENGESNLVLDDAVYTMRKFKKNFGKESNFSIYKIIRYGTHPMEGHRPYMPHYTLERMSDQQVEDLRAYIEQIAG